MTHGSESDVRSWICADLCIDLPAAFRLEVQHEEERQVLDIPGEITKGRFWRLADQSGSSVCLQYWSNRPPHPGEPLQIEHEWEIEHAGRVIYCARSQETSSLSNGAVFHTWIESKGGHYHLTAHGLEESRFQRIVESIRQSETRD